MERKRLTIHTKLTNYMPIPRSVLSLNLPSTAVILYGMLLDRATLSQKNEYADDSGWVYVVYTQEELAHALSVSTRMIKRYIPELEKNGLLRKVRTSRKCANRYYLCVPNDAVMGTGRGQPCPSEGTNPASVKGHPVPPNNIKKQHDFINIYQHGEEESL